MIKTKSPHPVDIHVGRRVKTRRVLREMSQTALADRIELTFQQLQKYESGTNRISASRLWHIAQILDVPVAWFFEGVDGEITPNQDMPDNEMMEMAKAVQALPPKVQKQAYGLMTSVVKYLDG